MRTAVAAAACGLLLAACGTPAEPPPTPAPSASGTASPAGLRPGSFSATLPGGASVHVTLPASPPPEVEKLRRDAGIRRALYARITIDNGRGTRPVSVSRVTVTSHDGGVYRLDALPRVVPDWAGTAVDGGGRNAAGRRLTSEQLRDLNDRVERVVRHYTGDVPVGGRGEEILVGDLASLPDSFARIELTPSTAQAEAEPVRPKPDPEPPRTAEPPRDESADEPPREPGGGGDRNPGDGPSRPGRDPEPTPDREPSTPAATPSPPGPGESPTPTPDGHPTPTGTAQAVPTAPATSAPPQAAPTGTASPEAAALRRG